MLFPTLSSNCKFNERQNQKETKENCWEGTSGVKLGEILLCVLRSRIFRLSCELSPPSPLDTKNGTEGKTDRKQLLFLGQINMYQL